MKSKVQISKIDQLIIDSMTGDLSAKDEKRLNQWINQDVEHRIYYNKFRYVHHSLMEPRMPVFDKEKAFDRFMVNISQNGTEKPRRNRSRTGILAALVAAALVALGIFLWMPESSGPAEPEELYCTIDSHDGVVRKTLLPDSSYVWLNCHSVLTYHYDSRLQRREVQLEGEAYFEVKKIEKLPFVVRTEGIDILVLGTKFNVSSYADDADIKVSLLEGSVALSEAGAAQYHVKLQPNNSVLYDKEDGTFTAAELGVSNRWIYGEIGFENATLMEVATRLEREFDVKIEIPNPKLHDRRFYGLFHKEMAIEEILNLLTRGDRLDYYKKEDIFYIYPK